MINADKEDCDFEVVVSGKEFAKTEVWDHMAHSRERK